MFSHDPATQTTTKIQGVAQTVLGIVLGVGIGAIAAILGVAGGELLIPTIVLLFGTDLKLAGSLSLAVSLPTMIVGFSRYSQDQSFSVLFRAGMQIPPLSSIKLSLVSVAGS